MSRVEEQSTPTARDGQVARIVLPVKSLYLKPLYVSPEMVSNGEWAVQVTALKEPGLFASVAVASAVVRWRTNVSRPPRELRFSGGSHEWQPTRWVLRRGRTDYAVWERGKAYLLVNREYAKMLHLLDVAVWADTSASLVTNARGGGDVVVMPAHGRGEKPPELFS